jgi:Arc/MetJ-type ribon-helix-helix transcriptional regulator
MAQLVTRVDGELVADIDALIEAGVVESRSDAVRQGLRALVDQHRRRRTGEDIVHAYQQWPQTAAEVGWADEATLRMIGEEPW